MMKETIEELNKRLEELSKKCANLEKAVVSLVMIEFEDHEKKRSMIDDIRQMVRKTSKEKQAVIDAINALQKVCSHTRPDGKSALVDCGNDSHYSYEKCDICGRIERC